MLLTAPDMATSSVIVGSRHLNRESKQARERVEISALPWIYVHALYRLRLKPPAYLALLELVPTMLIPLAHLL